MDANQESGAAVEPEVRGDGSGFVSVAGRFYRAVSPAFAARALDGSRTDGRYAPEGTPTLYLSSSRAGVAAALTRYAQDGAPAQQVLAFDVAARRIADLRDGRAMSRLGVDPTLAAQDWQEARRRGEQPASWLVRERLEAAGAVGLIDPSRKRPGLWHLTLFAWNRPGAPTVRPLGPVDPTA